MSRKIGMTLAFAFVLVAPMAQAAGITVGANGGVLSPMGDFSDGLKTGWYGTLFADYSVSSRLSIGADLGFSGSKSNLDGERAAVVLPGGSGTYSSKATIMPFLAHAKFMIPIASEKLRPYAVVGAGMYNFKLKSEATGYSVEGSDSNFGGRGGAGLMYQATPMVAIGAEGSFHYISTSGNSTQFVTGTLGISVPLGSK